MKFYICDDMDSPCIFTQRSWLRLKESKVDLKRCIRHGALICHEREANDKSEVVKWARPRGLQDTPSQP